MYQVLQVDNFLLRSIKVGQALSRGRHLLSRGDVAAKLRRRCCKVADVFATFPQSHRGLGDDVEKTYLVAATLPRHLGDQLET